MSGEFRRYSIEISTDSDDADDVALVAARMAAGEFGWGPECAGSVTLLDVSDGEITYSDPPRVLAEWDLSEATS